jgi:hypothetical protein
MTDLDYLRMGTQPMGRFGRIIADGNEAARLKHYDQLSQQLLANGAFVWAV